MLREIKATLLIDGGEQLLVHQIVDADVYWVPLQDVTRLKYKEFAVETVVRDAKGIERILNRVDLLKHPDIGREGDPPFFLGACDAGSFWAKPSSRLFFVETQTGTVKQLQVDPETLAFGKWERASSTSIRRSNEHGVFEYTPEGVRKLDSQIGGK